MTETAERPYRRNVHCSKCGDTRGGPVGHEFSECTWTRPRPTANYGAAWDELRGYVQEAADDGGQIDPAEFLTYMDALKRTALAPIREWITDSTTPPVEGA